MITQPKFSKLSTSLLLGFYTDVQEAINRTNDVTLAPYATPVQEMYGLLESGYGLSRANKITAEIKALDGKRDRVIIGLRKVVDGLTYHHVESKANKAILLLNSINKYGNIAKMGYSQQTAAITSLLNDWKEGNLNDALIELNLSDWRDELKEAQEKFIKRYLDRVDNDANNTVVPISKLVPEAIKVYQNFIIMVTAFAQINPEKYHQLAIRLDELGKRYNDNLRTGGTI